jgi:hypothetical protein
MDIPNDQSQAKMDNNWLTVGEVSLSAPDRKFPAGQYSMCYRIFVNHRNQSDNYAEVVDCDQL